MFTPPAKCSKVADERSDMREMLSQFFGHQVSEGTSNEKFIIKKNEKRDFFILH